MIWQENIHTVAMVTNLVESSKTKCQQYWPDEGSENFGPFIVTTTDQQVFANYIIRLLQLEVSYFSITGYVITAYHYHNTSMVIHKLAPAH